MDAKMAMRVPSTMRAWPAWAASQPLRRWAGVMPLCIDTTASLPKRARTRSSIWGVRLISGTMSKAWAWGSVASMRSTACKYTSVLPLPVLPNSKKGPVPQAICASTVLCSCERAGPGVVCTARSAFCFFRRRASCSEVKSRNWGGSAAKATSPKERW